MAFYKATPTSLFAESEFAGWTFKCEAGKRKNGDDADENETVKALEQSEHGSAKRLRTWIFMNQMHSLSLSGPWM